MRRVHSLAWSVLVAAIAALSSGATPAAAAPVSVHLGQTATEFNSGLGATGFGSCECTVAQYGDVGPTANSYTIPFDGVLTGSGFYLGESQTTGETVQLETVHRIGFFGGTVVDQGVAHSLTGRTNKAVSSFYDRVPAHAGDVLAARFETGHNKDATPYFFKAASGDEVRISNAPKAAGESLETASSLAAERRINVEAVIESDEDHDGFGDVSQDLCPGSAIATSACSGSLFGSNLQGERTVSGSCGCTRIQTMLNGVPTAAPFNGVVVRWRVLTAAFSGTYQARVVHSLGDIGGGFSTYRILRSSESKFVPALSISLLQAKIASFETRLPIAAGDFVGLSGGRSGEGFQSSLGASTYFEAGEIGLDGNAVTGTTHPGTLLYDADIEPDVDGDGYGDITQDSCPTSAAVHEGPCPVTPPPSGGGGGAPISPPPPRARAGADKPTISGLTVKPKSFLARPIAGAAASAAGSFGAKVKLTLSVAATVKLKIETKQGHTFRTVTALVKALGKGKRAIALSGQYRHAGNLTDLAPGVYRLSATAKDSAGTGPVKRTTFTVLPPA